MHPTRNYFAEFKGNHRIFIETGTYKGDGVRLAVEAGYERIHSIDIVPQEGLTVMGHISYHVGDSPDMLREILAEVNEPCMFWLDAHSQLMEGEADNFPLLEELKVIASHHIKTHTILIDDLLMMTHPNVTGWNLGGIINVIWVINREYRVKLLPNPIRENILLARI